MHVLPLPFGLALALYVRRDPRPLRDRTRSIRVWRAPDHRDRILRDPVAPTYRRPIV